MSASRRCCSVVILRRTLPDAPRQPHEQRHEHERDHRQPPVEQAHRDERRDHRGRVLRDRRRGRGDDVVEPADVVGDPRLHLAGARPREERQRHPLQVLVDGGAQVVHHALADDVRDVGLPDARARWSTIAIAIIASTSSVSSVVVVLEDPVVEHVAGAGTAGASRGPPTNDDQRQHDRQADPVGLEQRAGSGCVSRSRVGSISGGGFLSGPPPRSERIAAGVPAGADPTPRIRRFPELILPLMMTHRRPHPPVRSSTDRNVADANARVA